MGSSKGQSKKKAAKKASAEVKASSEAATAAAMTKTPAVTAPPEDDADALTPLVQLINLHANDKEIPPHSIVDATHEYLMHVLGPAPDGQSWPDGYGEMCFYAIAILDATKRGLVDDELHAYVDERVKESRLEHGEAIDRALCAYLADTSPERVGALCLMLGGVADAQNPMVEEVLAAGQQVHVAPAGEKGDGVFASHDLPVGTPFTIYPCHGLWVGGHNGCEDVGCVFSSPQVFPCSERELNIRYAIDTPRHAGPHVMIIGHHQLWKWFACGHLINDSHTVGELGNAEAYCNLARGNCEPKCSDMGSVVMFTTRAVAKGEELLYNYGAGRRTSPVKVVTSD